MSKFIDLTGQVFGRLTVMYRVENTKRKAAKWHCKCDCGNEVDVQSGNLKSGNTQSCGCYNRERVSRSKTKDLTGQRFGRLVVIGKSKKRAKDNCVHWECLCDCGKIVEVNGHNLRQSNTQSCGCYQREMTSKAKHKINIYDLSNSYGIGYASNTNNPFFFDKEDYDLIKDYCWIESDQGYVIASADRKHCRQHRLVLHLSSDDAIVDHRNNNRMDNRKSNLRLANKQLNAINRGCNSNNVLGCKGVSRISNGKYMADIMKDGKNFYLGCFESIDDAVAARRKAEMEMFGEFAFEEQINEQ